MMNLVTKVIVAATLVLGVSAIAQAQSEGDTLTVEGTVTFGASTDWNPPAGFTIENRRQFYWLDLSTNTNAYFDNVAVGDRLARNGKLAQATGYLERRGNELVLVAYNIVETHLDAPLEVDASNAKEALVDRYFGLANGIGITIVDGRYAVSMTFETLADLRRYKRLRRAERLDAKVEWVYSTRDGRLLPVAIRTEVIGRIVIQPIAGVAN